MMTKTLTNLQQRIISSLVMISIAVAAVIIGGDIFFSMLAILAIVCCFEVHKLLRTWPARLAIFAYILMAFAAAHFFREYFGWVPFMLMAMAIVLTDVGAYFVGRQFGGPKLAKTISPNKTWSGAIGGLLLAVIISGAVVSLPFFDHMSVKSVIIMSAIISISAQAGDLFESWLKRRAGVKDSSNLIPGHGGFLDRLDSWLGAFFVNGLIHVILVWVV